MSIEYLLVAARDRLRLTVSLPGTARPEAYIGLQPEGRPPATMGDFYVALDEAGVQSTEKVSLRELFAVQVYITKRTGRHAADKFDSLYLELTKGLRDLERQVLTALHNNQTVRAMANALAGVPQESQGDAYLQPLFYTGRSRSQFHGAEWIGTTGDNHAFIVRILNFSGGLRVQALDIAG